MSGPGQLSGGAPNLGRALDARQRERRKPVSRHTLAGRPSGTRSTGGGGGSSIHGPINPSELAIAQSGTGHTYGQLIGEINGTNTTFTVPDGAYESGSLLVFRRFGICYQGSTDPEDWHQVDATAGTLAFNTAPLTGDKLLVMYRRVL